MKIPALPFFLLVAALAFCGCKPSVPRHGVMFLVSVGTNQTAQVSSNEVKRVGGILARRVDLLGYPSWMERAGDNRISIKLPSNADKHIAAIRMMMTRGGLMEFFFVHDDSTRLLEEGIVPPGYALLKETRVQPGGAKTVKPFLVSKRPVPGLSGRNFKKVYVTRGSMNDPQISFQFDDEGKAAFAKLTSENIGKALAIVLDGELYSAPVIRSAITEGYGQISGGSMSMEEAQDVTVLMQFPLDAAVRILEERTF